MFILFKTKRKIKWIFPARSLPFTYSVLNRFLTYLKRLFILKVKAAVISDDFKINSAAITLKFLMRHGLVNADERKLTSLRANISLMINQRSTNIDSFIQVPNYLEILENLHAPGLWFFSISYNRQMSIRNEQN